MLADFYMTKVYNDMPYAVQKNHLGAQILYRTPNPVKHGANLFYLSNLFVKKLFLACNFYEHATCVTYIYYYYEPSVSDKS